MRLLLVVVLLLVAAFFCAVGNGGVDIPNIQLGAAQTRELDNNPANWTCPAGQTGSEYCFHSLPNKYRDGYTCRDHLLENGKNGSACERHLANGAVSDGSGYTVEYTGGQQTATPPGSTNSNCAAPAAQYAVFNPSVSWNWPEIRARQQPNRAEFLSAHGLTESDTQRVTLPSASWESALYVVELREELYGNKVISLLPGYVYSLALTDGSVQVMWGGDQKVSTACLQWGFSARWVTSYTPSNAGKWLNVENPEELLGREVRYGRYMRNIEMDLNRPDIEYFNRVGPYPVGTGNVDSKGWIPPSMDAFAAKTYMDACVLYGGTCQQAAWTFGAQSGDAYLNWHWAFPGKVAGSGTYCNPIDACWQQVYLPETCQTINGYAEAWGSVGAPGPNGQPLTVAGPVKYRDNPTLANPLLRFDEFTIHCDGSR